MSKIAAEFVKNVPWLVDISTINTVLFFLLLVIIIIGVLCMKKEDIDEYKNMPLHDSDEEFLLLPIMSHNRELTLHQRYRIP